MPLSQRSAKPRALSGRLPWRWSGLFGLANIWLAYPHFEASMREAHVELRVRLARVDSEAPQPKLKPQRNQAGLFSSTFSFLSALDRALHSPAICQTLPTDKRMRPC